jgi:hypothetical protein
MDGREKDVSSLISFSVISRKLIVLYSFSHAATISSRLVAVVFSEMAMLNPYVASAV